MHEAVDQGLDMAIINYGKVYPLYKLPQEEVELARKLIFRDETRWRPAAEIHAALRGHER